MEIVIATFICPECEHSQEVADKHVGKKTKCPKCSTSSTVRPNSSKIAKTTGDRSSSPIVLRENGGSIQTALGHGILLNKESTLEREFITVIDPTLPAGLTQCCGVKTVYERETDYTADQYLYVAKYSLRALQDIAAFEVRFLLFNIWGRHVQTLSATEISDMPANSIRECDGRWHLFSENDACEHYASIAYTAVVRTSSGQVFESNPSPVLEEAKKFSSKFSDSDLEPTPSKR